QPMTSAKHRDRIEGISGALLCDHFRSFHQPIRSPVVAKINPNTPIAKGNKLAKKLVPENRLAV
ncbi:MAG: hypothetical protein LUQ68_06785, partial [Methylococcaceae bacterium]|nr:hypothetical protein [Methylococcaceae bacterium]